VAIFPCDLIRNVSRHIYVPPRRGKGTRRRQFRISSARSHPLNNNIDPARRHCPARARLGSAIGSRG
jgi:hypothetical protein